MRFFQLFVIREADPTCFPDTQYWVSEKKCGEADQREAGEQEFSAMNHPTLFT